VYTGTDDPARDPLGTLAEQDSARVPELLPIRYGRMAASPFAFYRGAAAVMAADLASTPVSGLVTQACGDAHLCNFGLFGSAERSLVFDINDFDETLPGPWEWDVKRLAASLEVAGRDNGYDAKTNAEVVLAAVGQYREAMRLFAGMTNLDVWYAKIDAGDLASRTEDMSGRSRRKVDQILGKARRRDSLRELAKITTVVEDEPRIVAEPPLVVPIRDLYPVPGEGDALKAVLTRLLRSYRRTLPADRGFLLDQYRPVDLARKVVGVGSVGTRCWVALLLGRDTDDPLFLQVKEASASVLEPALGASRYANHGQRVVAGQRLMQATGDILLGWERTKGIDGEQRDFYVRQLRDWKGSVDVEQLLPQGMVKYGQLCAWTLARAHARSGDQIAIAGYLGRGHAFDYAVLAFAQAYADQNERDHQSLLDAIADGRVTAETGV
jgi:uncharacterized protein (DUF2252 family)